MNEINQVIEALELGLSEVNADGPSERMRQALTALREIKPATEEEMKQHALRDGYVTLLLSYEKGFRARERSLGIGEKK